MNYQKEKPMLEQANNYNKLCTEFYILDKQPPCDTELTLYTQLLQPAQGPWLEAMCGTGRLLIPLLQKGIAIDGVDRSPFMLQQCRQQCAQHNLKSQLFEQSLTDLDLPQQYAGIIIVYSSFQLLDRQEALIALQRLYNHLLPGGFLVLETFIPWDSIRDSIDGEKVKPTVELNVPMRSVNCPDGSTIKLITQITIHSLEQYQEAYSRYAKLCPQGSIIDVEEEQFVLQWYYRYELEYMLKQAGFTTIEMRETSLDINPQALIYMATK